MGFFIIAVIVILIIFIRKKYKAYLAKKRADLLEKYKDEQLVDLIMKKMFRMDMTEEQLIDSIGKPGVIDRKILKTKTKEIWKYNENGKNRFDLKITLENGKIIGWDKKG